MVFEKEISGFDIERLQSLWKMDVYYLPETKQRTTFILSAELFIWAKRRKMQ